MKTEHVMTLEQRQHWDELSAVRLHMRRLVLFLAVHVACDVIAVAWYWQR